MLCLVDGFNLYHSLRDCERDTGARVRWLDVRSMCASLLHVLPGECSLGEIVFFSALAHHVERNHPGTIDRHLRYLDALRATGVTVRLGQFKRRDAVCPVCGAVRPRYEEKETDVAIASRLLAAESRRRFGVALLVTGDTDLVPAITTARAEPDPLVVAVAFPYRRVNRQLRSAADTSLRLSTKSYRRHQLPMTLPGPEGRVLARPQAWN